jgi:hypothetical protein
MLLTVTVRQLKPGTYDAFRAAVVPDPWPPILKSIQVLRSQEDPDEVCTLGYLDVTPDELDALRDEPEFLVAEAARLERVSAFADTVVVNEIFELDHELTPPAG